MLRPPRADQPDVQTSLINMISQWGLTVGDDIVLDQELHLFQGPTLGLSPLVELYPPHPITRGFTKRTLWPMVRSVGAGQGHQARVAGLAVGADQRHFDRRD